VVLHHTLLVAAPYLESRDGFAGTVWWSLTATPLKVATAGGEAVVLFFVLSGLVVSLPALRGNGFSWSGFMASRVIRIMLPVWAALVFASALIVLIPRAPGQAPTNGWVADNNGMTLDPAALLAEAFLTRYSYEIDNVLWSLRWEMLFSLLLPVFVLAVRASARWWVLAGAAGFAVTVAGFAMRDGSLSYLPTFFLGALIAVRLEPLREWATRSADRAWFRWGWPVVLLLALLGFVASWIIPADDTGREALRSLSTLASVALIGLAVVAAPLTRFLSSRICAWLGKTSFSLYLVHVPILIALAYALGPDDWKITVVAAPLISLVVGYLFWRFVEKPSHRFARFAGRRFAADAIPGGQPSR